MKRKVNLFTSFYQDKNNDRASELIECLLKNSTNKDINRVILLNKPRPSYKDFFLLTQLFPEDINIISNTDIHFDESINLLHEIDFSSDICLALTRWDFNKDESLKRFVDRGSQDAWVFFGSVKNIDKMDASYTLGVPGCDNRIARELYDADYTVYNPSESIRIIHRHLSGIRNYKSSDTICGEHMFLDATRLDNMKKDTNYYYKLFTQEEIITNTPQSNPEAIQPIKEELTQYVPANPLKRSQANFKPIQANDRIRIQHIALMKGESGFPRALKKLGEYDEIDFGDLLSQHGAARMNQIIVERFNNFKPDLVFMQIQTDNVFFPETAKYISERSFFLHWGGDKRANLPQYFSSIAPFVSVTCCTCEEDIAAMKAMGWNAEFLQIGIDPEIYKPGLEKISDCPPIVFMGNNYGDQFPLSKDRRELVEFMQREFGNQFAVYGNGWPHNPHSFNHDQSIEARYYNSCKIAISYNHFNTDRYTSDRIFRILASGVLCLSHRYKGIEKDFKPGIHLETFGNFQELAEKCRQLLSNEETRNRIANAGKEYVHSKFTFDHMAENIINIYNKYKNESIGVHTPALR
jgi:glycosyltransferase involved in cell wall biosynthesis